MGQYTSDFMKFKRKGSSHIIEAIQWLEKDAGQVFMIAGEVMLPGDWLITYSDGTKTGCPSNYFVKMYEPVIQ
jgi:hypothetical protein